MTWVVALVAVGLVLVAAAGVLRPFGRSGEVSMEPRTDPLDEERASLLRALGDLEDERRGGNLSEKDYRTLRHETEARAVAVLRALEAREGAEEIGAMLREIRSTGSGNGAGTGEETAPRTPQVRRRVMAGVIVVALGAAVLVPALSAAVRSRTSDEPISGDQSGGSTLAFFERRVAEHPNDLAARLDLAERYLGLGDATRAFQQYREALAIDARNPEALSRLGWLAYLGGRPSDALDAVDLAIGSDPGYAEAFYFKGVILLDGLDEPDEAASALRRYLQLAPFGSYRTDAQQLLQQTETEGS
jgi:tetratricopeptide (TPR) repeat protein